MIAAGAGAFFWVAAGLLACYGASRLGLGSVAEPGAGFIFFCSGLLLVILSLVVFTDSARTAAETVREMVGDEVDEDCSGTSLALVVRLLLRKTGFCFDDVYSCEFLPGLHRGYKLVAIPRRSMRYGAGNLCDVRAMAKDQASQRTIWFLIRQEKNMALHYNKILWRSLWYKRSLSVQRQHGPGPRTSILQGRLKWSWHFPPEDLPT